MDLFYKNFYLFNKDYTLFKKTSMHGCLGLPTVIQGKENFLIFNCRMKAMNSNRFFFLKKKPCSPENKVFAISAATKL